MMENHSRWANKFHLGGGAGQLGIFPLPVDNGRVAIYIKRSSEDSCCSKTCHGICLGTVLKSVWELWGDFSSCQGNISVSALEIFSDLRLSWDLLR